MPATLAAVWCAAALFLGAATAAAQGVASVEDAARVAQGAHPRSGRPRLVLVVAIDQLRPDRLHAGLPGGLGRLVREGRSFDGWLEHALTETCPGHATMLTGRHPARLGIPSNEFFDEATGAEVYCAHDASPDAREIGGETGLSPAALRADALGDWLKRAEPASRVFTVGGKDRGAIMLGGRRPDGAYWYRIGVPPRFTTSRYYRAALPAWVESWNGTRPPEDGFLAALPAAWEHGAPAPGEVEDDFPGEGERFSRTSPHPLRSDDLAELGERLFATPLLDELTLAFALRLVAEEDLGRDAAPDLLALSLAANDVVGHTYGPASREAADALRRLDAALARLIDQLEERTGGALVVALTADHGVLPLPEWLERAGQASCPAPAPRTGVLRVGADVLVRLWWRHGPWLAWPRAWLAFAGSQGRVDRTLAASRGLAPEAVAAEAKAVLEAWPAVAHVWTADEIAAGDGDLAELYRRSFVPGRSGDLVVQPARGCLISPYDTGTSHGSPYEYDRRVPLVFYGAGVARGAVLERAATVDLAPTLAALLGVPAPADLDGRVLPLAPP